MADTLTLTIPIILTRMRHGRQALCPSTTEQCASLVVALARAYTWQQMLMVGEYASVHQLAASLGCDMSYVARTMNLALLAPDIVEAIIEGRMPGLTLKSMPKTLPLAWSEQRALLGII